jgi:hypothetical protein
VDLAHAVRDVLAGVVVPADGDVRVVRTVEGIAPGALLLQQDGLPCRIDGKAGERPVPEPLAVRGLLVLHADALVAVIEDVDQRHDASLLWSDQ